MEEVKLCLPDTPTRPRGIVGGRRPHSPKGACFTKTREGTYSNASPGAAMVPGVDLGLEKHTCVHSTRKHMAFHKTHVDLQSTSRLTCIHGHTDYTQVHIQLHMCTQAHMNSQGISGLQRYIRLSCVHIHTQHTWAHICAHIHMLT